ncbi:hypothetical protein [Methanothermobacter sp. THM-1]|uniref:hypothetical protein n=1 Tax=Methanothermobacter sp. THM-1 TaxID=2606911 RepID=UPI00192D4338|nr:hypothetical protein [Methanothermobacter sp. THM-1]
MISEIELLFKEKLEELGLVDTVVLDFNERIEGESVIILNISKLKRFEPVLNGSAYEGEFEAHITGIWKVAEGITDAIEKRNTVLEKLTSEFMYTNLGTARVMVQAWDKAIWQDVMDDTRYYVAFDITLTVKNMMR